MLRKRTDQFARLCSPMPWQTLMLPMTVGVLSMPRLEHMLVMRGNQDEVLIDSPTTPEPGSRKREREREREPTDRQVETDRPSHSVCVVLKHDSLERHRGASPTGLPLTSPRLWCQVVSFLWALLYFRPTGLKPPRGSPALLTRPRCPEL